MERLKFSQADACALLCDPVEAYKMLAGRDLSRREAADIKKTWDAEALLRLCAGFGVLDDFERRGTFQSSDFILS